MSDKRDPGGTVAPEASDALVIFGITGDLARKMTSRALYRLEKRGKLDCPIIGVGRRSDWGLTAVHQALLLCRSHWAI